MGDLVTVPASVKWISGAAPQGMVAGESLLRGQPVYQDETTLEFKLAGATLTNALAGVSLTDGFNDGQMIYAPDGAVIDLGVTTVSGELYCLSPNTGKIAPYSDLGIGHQCVFLFWGTGTSVVTLAIARSSKVIDPYLAYLLTLPGPVALWPLYDLTTTAVNKSAISNLNGTHNANVALANALYLDGKPAPYYNGVSANTEIYSAALNSNFDPAEGTLGLVGKFDGVWGDSNFYAAIQIGVDINNRVLIYKINAANQWVCFLTAGGSGAQRNQTTSKSGWFSTAITWNKAANLIRVYFDGAQVGADLPYSGTWVGALTTAWTDIGGASSLWYKGWLRNVVLFNKAQTPEVVATMHSNSQAA